MFVGSLSDERGRLAGLGVGRDPVRRFGAYYTQGRLPYAEGLADALRSRLSLDGQGRLLDVGCGPGIVTLRLAHLFEEVVGLDPDRDMLAEAERRAVIAAVANTRWVRMRAEELPGALGRFRVVAFAGLVPLEDRPKVAGRPQDARSHGVAVQIDAPSNRCDAWPTRQPLSFPTRFRRTMRSSSYGAATSVLTHGRTGHPQLVARRRGRRVRRGRLRARPEVVVPIDVCSSAPSTTS